MDLLWIGLFGVLCVAIGGLVVACDALVRSAAPGAKNSTKPI